MPRLSLSTQRQRVGSRYSLSLSLLNAIGHWWRLACTGLYRQNAGKRPITSLPRNRKVQRQPSPFFRIPAIVASPYGNATKVPCWRKKWRKITGPTEKDSRLVAVSPCGICRREDSNLHPV